MPAFTAAVSPTSRSPSSTTKMPRSPMSRSRCQITAPGSPPTSASWCSSGSPAAVAPVAARGATERGSASRSSTSTSGCTAAGCGSRSAPTFNPGRASSSSCPHRRCRTRRQTRRPKRQSSPNERVAGETIQLARACRHAHRDGRLWHRGRFDTTRRRSERTRPARGRGLRRRRGRRDQSHLPRRAERGGRPESPALDRA